MGPAAHLQRHTGRRPTNSDRVSRIFDEVTEFWHHWVQEPSPKTGRMVGFYAACMAPDYSAAEGEEWSNPRACQHCYVGRHLMRAYYAFEVVRPDNKAQLIRATPKMAQLLGQADEDFDLKDSDILYNVPNPHEARRGREPTVIAVQQHRPYEQDLRALETFKAAVLEGRSIRSWLTDIQYAEAERLGVEIDEETTPGTDEEALRQLKEQVDTYGLPVENYALPAEVLGIPVAEPKAAVCDCGALKSRTTHATWCSVYPGG